MLQKPAQWGDIPTRGWGAVGGVGGDGFDLHQLLRDSQAIAPKQPLGN